MIGHQRDILATLGIDLWIPRGDACQQHQPSIWRDQTAAEFHSDIVLPQSPLPETSAQEVLAKPVMVEAKTAQLPVLEAPAQVSPVQEQREILHIPAFSLQALSLAHSVIVTDATAMTEATQQLWANIQRAVQAEFFELNWPFPWLSLQDGRGVEAYIQGFLDRMGLEKHIIFLGGVPYTSHSSRVQLASLQEMLEQPLLKQRLWQLMQNGPVA